MRINTRLDEQSEQDLLFIQEKTGATITHIVKELLAERARQLKENDKPGSKMTAFLESGFIGCGEGPADGSVNYKKYVAEYLDEKYGDR